MIKGDFCLEDVGMLSRPFQGDRVPVQREVIMVIVAARGTCAIFQPQDKHDKYYGTYIPQTEAVRAFMEQHNAESSK